MGEAFIVRRGSSEGAHAWRKCRRSYTDHAENTSGTQSLRYNGAVFAAGYELSGGKFVLADTAGVIYIPGGTQEPNVVTGRPYAKLANSSSDIEGTTLYHLSNTSISVPAGGYAQFSYDEIHTVGISDTGVTFVVDDDESAYPDGQEADDGYYYTAINI